MFSSLFFEFFQGGISAMMIFLAPGFGGSILVLSGSLVISFRLLGVSRFNSARGNDVPFQFHRLSILDTRWP